MSFAKQDLGFDQVAPPPPSRPASIYVEGCHHDQAAWTMFFFFWNSVQSSLLNSSCKRLARLEHKCRDGILCLWIIFYSNNVSWLSLFVLIHVERAASLIDACYTTKLATEACNLSVQLLLGPSVPFFFFVYSSLFCTMFGCIITSVVQCKRLACISRNIWWRLTKQSSGIQLLTWVFIALLIRNGKGRCQGRLFCGKRTVNSSVLLLIIKR